MKLFLLIVFIAYFHNIGCEDTYSSKYDGVNLDEVLGSERLLTAYINCLLELGPCTPDGKELKKNLPDAIENDCKKCNKRQQEGADKVMQYIIDNRPDDWENLEKKYNDDGSYKKKYLASKKAEETKNSENKTNGGNVNSQENKD